MAPYDARNRDMGRADSSFAPSQCETSLQSNAVYHWLGAKLESALMETDPQSKHDAPTAWTTNYAHQIYLLW